MTTRRDLLRGGLALAAAGVAWTTQVHHLLTPAVAANEPVTRILAPGER